MGRGFIQFYKRGLEASVREQGHILPTDLSKRNKQVQSMVRITWVLIPNVPWQDDVRTDGQTDGPIMAPKNS